MTGHYLFPASRQLPNQFQYGGRASLNMATESTSKTEKQDIFKDVRFFLAEESNEEVCSDLLSAMRGVIVGTQTRLH